MRGGVSRALFSFFQLRQFQTIKCYPQPFAILISTKLPTPATYSAQWDCAVAGVDNPYEIAFL
jgi:hypothetical protein